MNHQIPNNNIDKPEMNNNIDSMYMFKTFKLRDKPLITSNGSIVPKWEKLPSYEWKKDVTKKYHLYTHMWKERTQEQLETTNCGVPCGKVNNIWVLDLDFYEKPDSDLSWKPDTCDFNKKFGNVEQYIKDNNLYAVRTISGGIHIYFEYDPLIKQTQNSVNHMDIRHDGGYVVSPFTKIGDKRYTILNLGDIKPCNPDLKQFVIDEVMCHRKPVYKTINKKIKIINPQTNEAETVEELEIDLDVYQFSFTDQILNQVSGSLPDSYFNSYGNWIKYTTAMKTLNRKDVWDTWCRKRGGTSYDKDKNFLIWSSITQHNKLFMVNHILIECGIPDARTMLDYYKYKPVSANPYEPHETIDHEKLGIDEQGSFIFFKRYQDKYLLVQSDTGTGKTREFKEYILDLERSRDQGRGWNTKGKFISIVSRVSLGKEQVRVFKEAGLDCYFHNEISDKIKNGNGYWAQYEGQNIVITIDSLLKLQNWDSFMGYNIYLDEYNSLIEYLICVKLLNKNRLTIYHFLINMMRQAERVICTDADINEISIRYMEIVLDKLKTDDYVPTFKYIKNKFKHNAGINAKEIFTFHKFVEAIDNENKWMICCDSKTQAEIISHINGLGKATRHYMLITADGVYRSETGKTTNETPDLDSCDCVIFSPAIVYGLDSVMKRSVYCYFKEQTISPCAMVQQLARCRNIKYLRYLFTSKRWKPYKYHNYKQVENEIIAKEKYGLHTLGRIDSDTGLMEECEDHQYIELRAKYDYRADCYHTNRFGHYIDIIQERGFQVDMVFSQTSSQGVKEATKELKRIKEEQYIKNCRAYKEYITPIKLGQELAYRHELDNSTEYQTKHIHNQLMILEDEWIHIDTYYNKQVIQLNDILKIPYNILEDYKHEFLTVGTTDDHFNITKFFNNDIHTIKEMIQSKHDFMCNKASMIESKLLLLDKFRDLTGCNVIDTMTSINDSEINTYTDISDYSRKKNIVVSRGLSEDQSKSFLKEYETVFSRCRVTTLPDLTDIYESQKHLCKMYKQLFGDKICKKTKSTKGGKHITYYTINDEYLAHHTSLYKFRLDYRLRQIATKGSHIFDGCLLE
tara:strand:+ start:658 stop:3897 length:3240 start_codon:yes stop_codon:yes gene_type:complete